MCGIYGFGFGPNCKLTLNQRNAINKALSVLNDSRGGQSYGYFVLDDQGAHVTKKGVGPLGSSDSDTLGKYALGFAHSRAATLGSICEKNAHPFEIGDIIGAHNGTINNYYQMDQKYNRNFPVDSMHIFAHINEGIDLKELAGWGTIEFWNKNKPKEIIFAKIGMGDLAICELDDAVFWSSDKEHLEKAMLFAKIANFNVYEAEERKVYKIVLGKQGELKTSRMKLRLGGFKHIISGRNCTHRSSTVWLCDGSYDLKVCEDCLTVMKQTDCAHS